MRGRAAATQWGRAIGGVNNKGWHQLMLILSGTSVKRLHGDHQLHVKKNAAKLGF